ncbi:zinc-binding alcohol dehydrogenase [Catenovulum agarivorans DS-2]|uniref:Zinc-binding alcohol dehydrogenase n=1 Tax=Catenovulum agarivorans DS-2 TaxID=1328313 RepID=W7QMM7_9ALTE|nr:MDR family oxidoreductase [Catenovulum agarivorans]EWH10202.1 zinc-binding alcohol dehydrogenase [Catenovulum agarivorans DS-2]
MFKGILIDKNEQEYKAILSDLDDSVLADGDTLVNVSYSTLNYKDALAITGKAPVVRNFPLIPGVDLVGVVENCVSGKFNPGDVVLLNGFGVGELYSGGLAQKAMLKSDWLIPLPKTFTPKQAMAIGTAGYTAMLCVLTLEKHGIKPESGEILVTGANGGVGSYAISILSMLGYTVVASTGRVSESAYLEKLGAAEIIDRGQLSEPGRPLAKERWAGVVDSVGSHTLVNACASTQYGGLVAACGLAQGMELPGTVAPFILRGITLTGIDSVMRPLADRVEAWDRLASLLSPDTIDDIAKEISLSQVIDTASDLIAGKIRGRVVVNTQQ